MRSKAIFERAICLLLMTLWLSSSAYSQVGTSFSIGHGTRSMNAARVGIQKNWEKTWEDKAPWPLSGYWEFSAYHIHAKPWAKDPSSNRKLQAFVLSGVAKVQSPKAYGPFYPYVELGFGVSQLTKREIVGRELSINFQFEDRLGIGARVGINKSYDIALRGVHFSNAFIGEKNHGFNLLMLVLGYWF